MSHKKICIIGAGGFGREVLNSLLDAGFDEGQPLKSKFCFLVEDAYLIAGQNELASLDLEVRSLSTFNAEREKAVIAIASPDVKRRLVESMPTRTAFTRIVHPSAVIPGAAAERTGTGMDGEIGEGTIITAGCCLTTNVKVGAHVHLNLHTTVGHDAQIGNYVTTAPGVHISGRCMVGDDVYLGTNAAVREGVRICAGATIGMGATVVGDISEPGVYVGVPAKKK